MTPVGATAKHAKGRKAKELSAMPRQARSWVLRRGHVPIELGHELKTRDLPRTLPTFENRSEIYVLRDQLAVRAFYANVRFDWLN